MSCYENLVMKTQMNYSRHYSTYASGGTAVVLSKQKPLPYEEQIQEFVRRVQEAECIIVGGASGLSAAGGGDFYYSDTPSFREHFGKFADKYGFKGAFSGMMHRFSTRNGCKARPSPHQSRVAKQGEFEGELRPSQTSRCSPSGFSYFAKSKGIQGDYLTMNPSSSHKSCQSFAPSHKNTCPLTSRFPFSRVAIFAISSSVSGSSVTHFRLLA